MEVLLQMHLMWIKNHSRWGSLFLDPFLGICGPPASLLDNNCISCNGRSQHQAPFPGGINCRKGNDKQSWNVFDKTKRKCCIRNLLVIFHNFFSRWEKTTEWHKRVQSTYKKLQEIRGQEVYKGHNIYVIKHRCLVNKIDYRPVKPSTIKTEQMSLKTLIFLSFLLIQKIRWMKSRNLFLYL